MKLPESIAQEVEICLKQNTQKTTDWWGKRSGVGGTTISRLRIVGVVSDDVFSGLSGRARTILDKYGVATIDQAKDAITSGTISKKTRNCGEKTLREICNFLKVHAPRKGKGPWRFDPWSGERI